MYCRPEQGTMALAVHVVHLGAFLAHSMCPNRQDISPTRLVQALGHLNLIVPFCRL